MTTQTTARQLAKLNARTSTREMVAALRLVDSALIANSTPERRWMRAQIIEELSRRYPEVQVALDDAEKRAQDAFSAGRLDELDDFAVTMLIEKNIPYFDRPPLTVKQRRIREARRAV